MSAYTDDPQTRVEAILQNILGKNNLLQPPQTRVEELLLLILNQGLGGVTYKGVTTTELTDGSTTNPIIIDGNEVEAQTGDFVAYDGKEFVWNGETWQELGDLELVVAVMSSIAPQYISTNTYNIWDRVYQDNVLYECDDDNVTGEFNPLKWHQVTITQILAEIDNNIQSIFGMISDTYDPDEIYNIGRLVIHNKKLYKCNTDGTTGAWNSAKWDETTIAYELENATPVEANPAEDATAELNKIKIFDDVYSVGNAHFRPIKQVEYDALSESEQKNGTIYFIYDAPALEVTANPEDDPEQPLVKLSIDGVIYYVPAELPEVTSEDDGKILKVVDGAWVAIEEEIIDDTTIANDKVWSSSKVDTELSSIENEIDAIIDDTTTASTSTWSSEKINDEIEDVVSTKTVTGNPVEFADGSDSPLVKCVTAITGSQDLHGYSKPWVGGAGKNKYGITLSELKNINQTGTWADNVYTWNDVSWTVHVGNNGYVDYIAANGLATATSNMLLTSTTTHNEYLGMVINGCPSDGAANKYQITGWNQTDSVGIGVRDTGNGLTIPNDLQDKQYRLYCSVNNGYNAQNLVFRPMIRLASVTDPTFAPYSNICHITAYTEGEIEVRGKNLMSNQFTSGKGINSSGAVVNNSDRSATVDMIPVFPETTYTISYAETAVRYGIFFYDKDGNKLSSDSWFEQGSFTTPALCVYIRFLANTGTAPTNAQLELGSRATPYEPYTSTTHTTTYPSAIYRGSEDVVNGEMTHDMPVIDLGDLTWNKSSTTTGTFYATLSDYKFVSNVVMLCSAYNYIGTTGTGTPDLVNKPDGSFMAYYKSGDNYREIYFKDIRFTEATDFANAVDGVQLAYELAIPTTTPVTPTNLPIKSLLGYNHIESTTGDLEVQYITKSYQPIIDLINDAVELPKVTYTDNGKVLTVVNGSWDKSLAPHIYSTTEQVVGKWIDGSDLYEITLQFTSTSTADTFTSVAHSISNVDVIYVEKAFVVGATYTQEMAPVGGLTGNDWFQGAVNPTSFDYQVGNDFVSCPVYVILRYTKSA